MKTMSRVKRRSIKDKIVRRRGRVYVIKKRRPRYKTKKKSK